MKRIIIPCLILVFSSFSQAVELMKWERLPLAVPLIVGQERIIFIDRNVRVGMPASLNNKLRIQTTGGSIYLLATEEIAPTRLQLQDVENGSLILLDIAALPASKQLTALEPVRIVEEGTRTSPAAEQTTVNVVRQTPVPVILTRYAAQSLYAPLRTVEPVNGIGRVNLRKDLNLSALLPSLPIKAQALAAWRLEDYWVTAIRLKNTSPRPVELDPRRLQGDFIAATFQHTDLGPVGQSTDTTVVYLVTRRHGLAESLLPAISRFDASINLPVGEITNEK